MNPLSLAKTLFDNFFFMYTLTRKLGAPIHLSEAECEKVFENLNADKTMTQKFAFIFNIKEGKLSRHLNTEKFLPYSGFLDLNKFFMLIHPNYMEEYLKWGRAVYTFLMKEQPVQLDPLNQCTKVTIPLKLIDGKYHWVLQEAIPLQVDAANNLISHLNIYSIVRPMEASEKVQLDYRLYINGFETTEWTKVFWKGYFTLQPFDLTPDQTKIVQLILEDNTITNAEIGLKLIKQKNSIDMQNKHILAKARTAFTHQNFENIRDVVSFLKTIHYFDKENFEKYLDDDMDGISKVE